MSVLDPNVCEVYDMTGDEHSLDRWRLHEGMEGNLRFTDGGKGEPPIVDMGAYEKQPGDFAQCLMTPLVFMYLGSFVNTLF